mgnify:CR=1 FL=1
MKIGLLMYCILLYSENGLFWKWLLRISLIKPSLEAIIIETNDYCGFQQSISLTVDCYKMFLVAVFSLVAFCGCCLLHFPKKVTTMGYELWVLDTVNKNLVVTVPVCCWIMSPVALFINTASQQHCRINR